MSSVDAIKAASAGVVCGRRWLRRDAACGRGSGHCLSLSGSCCGFGGDGEQSVAEFINHLLALGFRRFDHQSPGYHQGESRWSADESRSRSSVWRHQGYGNLSPASLRKIPPHAVSAVDTAGRTPPPTGRGYSWRSAPPTPLLSSDPSPPMARI
jgi:hypothetical protein